MLHYLHCSDISASTAKLIFPYQYKFGAAFDEVGIQSGSVEPLYHYLYFRIKALSHISMCLA